jgi:hypothetical protein
MSALTTCPMRHRGLPIAIVVLGLSLAGCGSGGDKTTTSASQPFTVTSTLDGKHALPHRIRWIAKPSPSTAKVTKVEFLVDGKTAWIEGNAPYYFSEDGGYLVTSWIKPGLRTFTVRASSKDGRTATDTVRARVSKAPAPPAALAGTWARHVDTTDAPQPGSAGNPTDTLSPPGAYRIVFDSRQFQTRFPGQFTAASIGSGYGWILDSDYTVKGGTLRVVGDVATKPFTDSDAEGGFWCYPAGPPATYRWSVSGSSLKLAPVGKDPCGIRGFIWTGTWTRK